MPPAEGNFNKELELLWGGKGVAARGPLEWGDEGTSLSLNVVITQDDTGAAASGRTGDDVPHGANEFIITAAIAGDRKLKEGAAMATGSAWIHTTTGIETYQWSSRVTLTKHQPAAHLAEDLSKKARARA